MTAFKGFAKDLTAVMGRGTFRFEPGKTYAEKMSKCARSGFHCAEYPFDCFRYYSLDGENRFFMVEAEGSIDEDGTDSRIACTRITLLDELTPHRIAYHGMEYIVRHPEREWEYSCGNVNVSAETAWIQGQAGRPAIAVARGKHPAVKGPAGSVLGLMAEPEPGYFSALRLFKAGDGRWKADTWYTVDGKGMIVEAGEGI